MRAGGTRTGGPRTWEVEAAILADDHPSLSSFVISASWSVTCRLVARVAAPDPAAITVARGTP